MATYTKRGNAYLIRASSGLTVSGKQVRPSMTWKPTPGMSERQIEKELQRQMVLFEEECHGGVCAGHIKFEAFAEQWFNEYAAQKLGKRTISNYRALTKRVYPALGHLYMDKLSARQIQKFISGLSEPGANEKDSTKGLHPKSIRNYLSFISSVFAYALRMGVVKENPCPRVVLPERQEREKNIFTIEETQAFLDALDGEPLRYVVFFVLAIFGGYRREELLGFEFRDFNFTTNVVTVARVSLYDPAHGIFTGPPKTARSHRSLKLPAWIFDMVKALRTEQAMKRLELGDQWHESGRLFTKLDGSPARPGDFYDWGKELCERHGLPWYGIHQFRHLNASLLIANHTDVRTVPAALGHSQTSTTLNIYSHAFETAQAEASAGLAAALPVNFGKKKA